MHEDAEPAGEVEWGERDEHLNCDEALGRLYDFLDSEMTDADIERIRDHIAGCGPCLAEYDLEEHVKALVRRSCTEKAPESLRLRVMTQITMVRSHGSTRVHVSGDIGGLAVSGTGFAVSGFDLTISGPDLALGSDFTGRGGPDAM